MKLFQAMLLGMVMITNVFAVADIADAEALIKKSTVEVVDALQADASKIHALVDKVVLPNFDFHKMSALVLGKHWKDANGQQRSAFAIEFRHLLVRTYSTALVEIAKKVNKNDIKYSSKKTGKTRCQVSTNVKSASTSIKVDYAMYYANGKWQVYNVFVEGPSLVTNYRDEFSREIKTIGIDGLINKIKDKNKG